MKPKKQETEFWSKMLDRRQLLKTLGVAGSVMALSGPRGLTEAMGQVSSVEAAGLSATANDVTGE
ncbi:MAG: twin-arginine translocation signal domain-containing protein, partial [Nitrospirota bacterium]|nr:twin-arginine translocation signal domain-containing protein [Nitrospirota bacterium]